MQGDLIKRSGSNRLCRVAKSLQYLDVKQLAELEVEYKSRSLKAYKIYREWVEKRHKQTDAVALAYGHLEGRFLRQQAEDLLSAYWIVRRDFKKAYEQYMQLQRSHKTPQG